MVKIKTICVGLSVFIGLAFARVNIGVSIHSFRGKYRLAVHT